MAIDEIDPELCNGCGVCVNSCPMDVIRMDGKSRNVSRGLYVVRLVSG